MQVFHCERRAGVAYSRQLKHSMTKSLESELLRLLCDVNDPVTMKAFLKELLTHSEYMALQKRWKILRLLQKKVPQREVARQIGGSLCNVTRGARLLRRKQCITRKLTQEQIETPTGESHP